MRIKNNWFHTNVKEIITNPIVRTYFEILDTEYTPTTFKESCDTTIREIGEEYNNIYLAYSGGLDSQFIFNLLLEHQIPFTPVLVETPGSKVELEIALYDCKKYQIEPIIIEADEEKIFEIQREIFFPKNVSAVYSSVPKYLCALEIEKTHRDYVLLSGENPFDYDGNSIKGFHEYEFYFDLVEENFSGDFLSPILYKNSTVLESWKLFDGNVINENEFKAHLYGIPFRPKYRHSYFYTQEFLNWTRSMRIINAYKAEFDDFMDIEKLEIKGLS